VSWVSVKSQDNVEFTTVVPQYGGDPFEDLCVDCRMLWLAEVDCKNMARARA
jgi:hypothetical protein